MWKLLALSVLPLAGCGGEPSPAPRAEPVHGRHHVSTVQAFGSVFTFRVDTATGASKRTSPATPQVEFNPPPEAAPGPPGRYTGAISAGESWFLYTITDTATGRSWMTTNGVDWQVQP